MELKIHAHGKSKIYQYHVFLIEFLCDCVRYTGRANGDQDKLKEELKNIIDDLNDNLNSMKQQVAQQARQISQLQHEKDALGQRLKDMQAQTANNKQLKDNIAKLQQQLKCEFCSTVAFSTL